MSIREISTPDQTLSPTLPEHTPVATSSTPSGHAPSAPSKQEVSATPTASPVGASAASPPDTTAAALAVLSASPAALASAFERMRPKLEGVPEEELGRVTTNVPNAVVTVMGAADNIAPLRDEIVRQLPEHDIEEFDNLPHFALALLFAHLMTAPSAEIETRMQALLAEVAQQRAQMLAFAETLVLLGLLDGERVASIRSGTGYVDTVKDVMALAQLFHDHRDVLEGKTPFSADYIARAHQNGIELLRWLGRRKMGREGPGKAGTYEQAQLRAFRLTVKAYGSTRSAVAYVRRREGDVDELMPSLFGGRPRRRGAAEPGVPTAPTGPSAPVDPKAPDGPSAPVDPNAPADPDATGTE